MFAATVVSLFALSAVAPSVVASHGAGRHMHRAVSSQPKERGYAVDEHMLEPYDAYSARYQNFGCADQSDTYYTDACCHPLLKDEPESFLPAWCWPTTTTTSQASTGLPSSSAAPKKKPASYTSQLPVTTAVVQKPVTTSAIPKPEPPAEPITTKPHTTSVAAPSTPSTSPGGGGGNGGGQWTVGGFGTYFYQNGNAGACGNKNSDDAHIVAIDIAKYGYDTSKASELCGKRITVVNLDNGNSVDAVIADVCPTCINENCLDLSVGTFKALEPDLSVGQLKIKYKFI